MLAQLTAELLDTYRVRRSHGESLKALAGELGITWQKLDKAIRNGIGSREEMHRTCRRTPDPIERLTPTTDAAAALVDKYRPQTLCAVRGQPLVVKLLKAFVAKPFPTSMLFYGPTGTGKTSTAVALAADLGCDLAEGPLGGLVQIASGEQTVDTVRETARLLWQRPMYGSGWKVLVINECDRMHPQTETVWLDRLENLPPQTVVIFTTNNLDKLPPRFADRSLRFHFTGEATYDHRAAVERLLADVWLAETDGRSIDRTQLAAMVAANVDADGQISYRRALQALQLVLASN